MKAKSKNSINVYIDEKGQVHSIAFAIKKALDLQLSTLEERVTNLFEFSFIEEDGTSLISRQEVLEEISKMRGKA